jgi:hypothetical protein
MKEVTAVQWLIHQLITENEVTLKGENYKLFELAKEIEREQMIKFYKWMLENNTEQNAEKYFHFTDSDMLNEYYKQD